MTAPREEWHLDTHCLGRRVLVYDRVASTSDLAACVAGKAEHDGLVLLADEQTAGRGQHGRSWLAPPRASVLLSVLFGPPALLRRPVLLTAWAAVAACRTVEEYTGLLPRIKWPNDVLLDGRKVCGILIEQSHGSPAPATILGVGLNVRQSAAELLGAGLPQATSLALAAPAPPDTYRVARQLIRQLDRDYERLCRGDLAHLEAAWREHLDLEGRVVTVECADRRYHGDCVTLGFGGVELVEGGGKMLRLLPESVLHLDAWT
jgi:BirA family biotin operon repressor/biotin-[acetyl-CoA-carboxylase] ligase